jgi:hypothetical protein
MSRGRRGLLLAAGLAAVAAAVWMGAAATGGGDGLAVERRDLVLEVAVTGALAAVRSDVLGPPQIPETWNYKIAYLAPEGAEVEAGTPVVRFDPAELERALLAAVADRDAAAAELAKERTDLERRRHDAELGLAEARARLRRAELKVAVPPELASAHELTAARLDLDLARREVASLAERLAQLDRQGAAELAALAERRDRAAARVAEKRDGIERMTVRAPRDGTVVWAGGRRGEKKKVGDQVWQMESVVEIPDLRRMRGEGEVDEADAGRVAAGQPVTLTLDAHPDVDFRGRVSAVHRVVARRSRADPGKVVRLDLELAETDTSRMRPGMRFQGAIEIERAAAALVAPAAAVFGDAGGAVVFRRALFGAAEVRPAVGRRNAEWVEILGGLAPGDRLAVRPPRGWDGRAGSEGRR